MKKTTLLFITICSFLFACNSDSDDESSTPSDSTAITQAPASLGGKLQQVAWMVGTWEMRQPEGILTETWKAASDTEMTGTSVLVSEKAELLFSEKMRIVSRGNDLWYMTTVSNQNEGKEVGFQFKTVTGGEIIFENASHDFPQRIIYKQKEERIMYARIEGDKDGLSKQEEFEYNRTFN